VNESEEDIEKRLSRIARATEPIRASAGFSERVMLAVQAEEGTGWLEQVLGASRRLLPVAALAAALGILWDVQAEQSDDGSWAVSDAGIELEL